VYALKSNPDTNVLARYASLLGILSTSHKIAVEFDGFLAFFTLFPLVDLFEECFYSFDSMR
jgi:hypothetical protein